MQLKAVSSTKNNFKFEEYYKKYYPLIFKVCSHHSNDFMDTMDLAHDVFIKCYENFPNFKEKSKVSSWIYRIAVNAGIDYGRKKGLKYCDSKILEIFNQEFEELVEDNILNKMALEKLFSPFSPKTKEILFLYYVENLNQVEISQLRGISRQAVKKHLDKFDQYYGKLRQNLIRNVI